MDVNNNLKGMSVALLSLGCKVNSYETDAMRQAFAGAGAEIMDFTQRADIYVVNTCSVTNIADRKSRQMLHRAKHLNPRAIVVAAGCYVQTAGDALLLDECVDLVVGNNRKSSIVSDVSEYLNGKAVRDIVDIAHADTFEELAIDGASTRCRAYIKIQDGCNQFCSYCIIPYARGRIRSRAEDEIFAEVERLGAKGYKEIVLTGIHISSYGMERNPEDRSFENNEHLGRLIHRLCRVEGIKRIRLGSLEPRIITPGFVKALAEEEKICPHFHLSLQSGSDATLARMNRHYTTGRFMEGCDIIREHFNMPALTTDVIVGFPGETEHEFEQSRSFLERVRFSKMHIFKYSRRKGTAADKMENQIDEAVKSERSEVLRQLDLRLEKEYLEGFIGSEQKVLFEESIKKDGTVYAVGHNERYAKIALETDMNLENVILPVGVECFLTEGTLIARELD